MSWPWPDALAALRSPLRTPSRCTTTPSGPGPCCTGVSVAAVTEALSDGTGPPHAELVASAIAAVNTHRARLALILDSLRQNLRRNQPQTLGGKRDTLSVRTASIGNARHPLG